jgi:hypothetical protein
MNIFLIFIYILINITTGFLIAIILKHLKKTLHRRETILIVISADLARALFIFISTVCWIIIYREFSGPFGNEVAILAIAAVIQEVHFLLVIIALCLQTTTFLFFFFGQKMISWNKAHFAYIYRLLAITASILGTLYFCQEKMGLFAKIPLYYYFFDDTADGRKLVFHGYSYFLLTFMVLLSGMQIAIEWQKRQLKQKDQIAKSRANEASQRLSIARIMMRLTTLECHEKLVNSNVFSSMPSLVSLENYVSKQPNHSKLLLQNSLVTTLAITSKYYQQVTSRPKLFVSKVSPCPSKPNVICSIESSMLLKKAKSCPNFQSLLTPTEIKNNKAISKNMTKTLTRAISIFIVFPTILLAGHVISGGFKLAKPHSSIIFILFVYGIVTPFAYILGKPNVRKVFMEYLKI